MREQNILFVSEKLSDKQMNELQEWWEGNYLTMKANRKLTIPLANHYVDIELRIITLT